MVGEWAFIALEKVNDPLYIRTYKGIYERCDDATKRTGSFAASSDSCYFYVTVDTSGSCQLS